MGPGSYPWAGSRTPGVDKHQPCPDLAALKVNKETTNGIRTFKKKKCVKCMCTHVWEAEEGPTSRVISRETQAGCRIPFSIPVS